MIQGGPSARKRGVGIFADADIPAGTTLTHTMMVDARVGFDHSCVPNVGPVQKTVDPNPQLANIPFRVTLSDIKAGDELCVDYGLYNAKPVPCDCPKCTGATP